MGQEALGIKPAATLVRECVCVHVLCVKRAIEEWLIRFGGIFMRSSRSQLSHVPVSSPMYTSENHFRTAGSFEFVLFFLRSRG